MELLRDVLSWVLLVGGGLVAIASGIGLRRLPDLYTRMHAAGMLDSLGALCVLAGLGLQSGASLVTFKLALVYAFLLLTTATASHALGKSALRSGLRPLEGVWPAPGEAQSVGPEAGDRPGGTTGPA